MKNDIDDLLNSVFGSRTLRTGGQAAGLLSTMRV
mgnify:CR=1 FL=1